MSSMRSMRPPVNGCGTADDGPTAAVVEHGIIAFNTESCELEVITTDGRPLWKKWLGDPLMSMPTIADGKVYMAYPNSRGDRKYYVRRGTPFP
jgi:outer membrane protein assembly factor BamB